MKRRFLPTYRGWFDFARTAFLAASLVLIAIIPTGVALALDRLAYSFEADANGFHANGGGITVTQDTVGATDGTQSLKVSMISGAGFSGALTGNIDLDVFGNPPGLDHVTFDLTLPSSFPAEDPANPGQPLPGFANLGVTVFGMSQDGTQLGLQAQFFDFDPAFNNEEHIDGLAAGLHKDFIIDLTSAVNPLTFAEHQSYNQIFGTGTDQLVPTGFQIYINKTTDTTPTQKYPITIYLDNIRVGATVAGDYNRNGIVDTADYNIWRDTLGSTTDLRANGDNNDTSAGKIDDADYVFWKSRYGAINGNGSVSAGSAPEPASALLLMLAGCYFFRSRWQRRAR